MDHPDASVATLRGRLRRAYRRDALLQAVARLFWTLAVGGGAILAFLLLEALIWMPAAVRVVLLSSAVLGGGFYLGARVVPPLLQWVNIWPLPSDETLARTVGRVTPAIADRLVTLFQLDAGRTSHAPAAVRTTAVQQLSEALDAQSFDALVDADRVRHALPWLLLPALAVAIGWTVLPDASARLFAPGTSFERPAPYALQVQPGDVERVQGEELSIEARLVDRIDATRPEEVMVEMDTPDGLRTQRMTAQSDENTWTLNLPNVREGFTYRVRTPQTSSSYYTVDVAARPVVRGLQAVVTPPAYTNRAAEQLSPNRGDVTALRGSNVELTLRLGGGPITEAVVRFEDGSERPLEVDDGTATGGFTVDRSTTYRIHLRNDDGVANPDPVRYEVQARADQPPRVEFEAPEARANLGSDRVADLQLRLRDDFGFSRLRIHYRMDNGDDSDAPYESFDIPLSEPRNTDQRVAHTWMLVQDSGLDLLPGDEVVYYAEVQDNDAYAGFKSAETPTRRLRMPTAADRYADLDRSQDDTERALNEVRERSSAMQQQFEQLRDEVRRTQEASWEDRSAAEQLSEQQQAMSEQVEQAARQLEEATRQMERDGLAREETQQMYRELQDIVSEIDDPELQQALRDLQDAMESMDFRDMQEAMSNVDDQMQDYQERLERAMELFKRLRTQQKLDEMSDRAQQLSEQQQALLEDTEAAEHDAAASSEAETDTEMDTAPEASADLSRRQGDLQQEMDALEQALDELAANFEDTQGAPTDDLEAMRERMEEAGIQDQMEAAAEALQQQDWQPAQDAQQQASDGLGDMSSSLSQMQEGMSQQQSDINAAAIWYALENTLWLSNEQERLRSEVGQFASDGAQLRTLVGDQQRLRTGLQSVGDSLSAVARNTPQLSRVVRDRLGAGLNAMQEAVQHLDERQGHRARPQQTQAMTHLNELALLLSEVLDQMDGSGGGEGGMSMDQMIQQMQEMTGDQQSLNRALQEHLQNVAGERLSVDEEARREQIAAEQQRLQEALRSLNEEDAADQLMGDLDRIADEMEQSLRDLENPRNERDLLDRQQRIVSRMLEAQRALQAQGQSDDREGDAVTDFERRASPDELPPEDAADILRQGLLDAMEGGYSPDYEALIRRYFEALEEE
ncbi:MAG: DUF4175 family protein [Longimonas sp.]|uniref:DUF4175 family protein n=1 Tax=Longimonas sp. TaxID=2039626 RepID=UPI0033485EDF